MAEAGGLNDVPDVVQGTPEDLLASIASMQKQRRFAEAAALCRRSIEAWPDHPLELTIFLQLLHSLKKDNVAPEVLEAEAGRAIGRFPSDGALYGYRGAALVRLGRSAEAIEVLRQALKLAPGQVEARALLRGLESEDAPVVGPVQKWYAWPKRFDTEGDVAGLLRAALLRGYPRGGKFIGPETVFMTMGSCFAHNLAARLETGGYRAYSEFLGEEVNSTYANRYLLEWVEHGVISPETQAMDDCYGEELRERMRGHFTTSDVLVLTLGLAPSFFDRETGRFFFVNFRSMESRAYLLKKAVMRSTSVMENIENLQAILASARRLTKPGAQLVVSVSPVPLGASAEIQSAVIADCVSKSILRAACHEVVNQPGQDDVHYWPSFEMVRWLGTYLENAPAAVFGAEDGNSRHVSRWMVDVIIGLFLETYAKTPAMAEAVAARA